jgi:hypothetical protein
VSVTTRNGNLSLRTTSRSLILGALLIGGLMLAQAGRAETMDEEIDFLIGSVGTDGCSFVRNGERYSARAARKHLNSKRRRNAQLITSTEFFIDKIASRSATTGDPYLIRCQGKAEQNAAEWFHGLLATRRAP